MPQRIEVPGMGLVEFPDGMDDNQIVEAIRKNVPGPVAGAPAGGQALPPQPVIPAQTNAGVAGTPITQPMSGKERADDFAKSFEAGVIKDAVIGTAGMFGDLSELGARGLDRTVQGIGGLTGLDVGASRPDQPTRFGAADIQKAVESKFGEFHKPKSTEGEYGQTVGGFTPALFGGGGLINRAARWLVPSLAGETAGQLTEDEDAKPYVKAGVTIAAPFAMAGLRRALTPFPTTPERMGAVRTLEAEGVPVTAGQQTGSKSLRYAESELGGRRAGDLADEQNRAFTGAAMRRAGADGLADSDNMRALNDRLGQGFRDISARNTLSADQQFGTEILATVRDYGRVLPAEQKQIFGNIVGDLIDRFHAGGGTLSGADYQQIRSRLTKLAHNARGSDNELADAYRRTRNALDDAMERSIAPGDAGEWGRLRREYGNMKTIEKAIAPAGGEDAGLGIISPARLRMAASQGNKGRYARGEDDFAELAKAGQAVMTPLPNSGTAGRVRAQNLGAFAPMIIGASAGGGYGAQEGGLLGGLAGAALGAGIPRGVGAAMMSRPGQAILRNQRFAEPSTPTRDALVSAIISMQKQNQLPSPMSLAPTPR